jgi:hypothetical protein
MDLLLAISTSQAVTGYVLIGVGVFFVLAGGLLLLRKALKEAQFTTMSGLPGFGDVITWLLKQGTAGGLIAVGLILIAIGAAMLEVKIW